MNQIVEQFSNVWKGISFGQKLVFIVMTLGFAVALFAVTFWVRTPNYGLLYGDMSRKDASEVVAYLKDHNIPYKITDNGSTVLIPSNMIYEARMSLANANLPRGDVGFELFDKNQFGMSDLAQRVNYRRALQGELSKTITQLDGIRQARVQIVIPEASLFDKKPATASVVLWTHGRNTLDASKIAGITHLVSTSVEGLSPENITITDNMGNLLSKAGDSKVSRIIADQFDLNRKIEDHYTSKVMSILEKITGPNRSKVKIHVSLDFNHIDERHIEYDQKKRVPRNQVVTTQSTEVPQDAGGADGGRFSREKKETETTVYELSRVERNISENKARIKRLTVAILVDGMYEKVKGENGEMYAKYIPRTEDELNRIAAVVKQAIGFDESPPRNDKLEIQSVEFQSNVHGFIDFEGIEKADKREFILSVARNASLGIAVLAFLWFAARALRRILATTGGYATYPAMPELMNGQTEKKEDTGLAGLDKPYVKFEDIRSSLIENIKSNPKTTSNLVKKWLKESEHAAGAFK